MSSKTEYVTLQVSDGTSMKAYVAYPEAKPRGGMMVFQEAFGVNQHIREVTEKFAADGYLSIAPEFFHRTAPGFEGSYTDFGPVREHMNAMTIEGMEADIKAAYDWLKAKDAGKMAAIGYCMGGRAAFIAASHVQLDCAISYYGGGIGPNANSKGLLDRVGKISSPLLFFWGGMDQHILPEQINAVTTAMNEAKKPFTNVAFSYADHGFSCDARASYNREATDQAWALTKAFLDKNLG